MGDEENDGEVEEDDEDGDEGRVYATTYYLMVQSSSCYHYNIPKSSVLISQNGTCPPTLTPTSF